MRHFLFSPPAAPHPRQPVSEDCKSSGPIDIGFALDSSGSMRKADLNKMKKAIVDLIGMFEVSKKGLHVGVIKFQTTAFLEFDFANAANSNKKALIAAVEKVKVIIHFGIDSFLCSPRENFGKK